MTNNASGPQLTWGADPRVTRIGGLLRKSKLDELPQLWNVLCGDMSIVGPRPEVPTFVDRFHAEYREILQVRPGITDPASIVYRSEAELLAKSSDPMKHYVEVVLPDKIRLSKEYVRSASVTKDLMLIVQTINALLHR